MPSNPDSINEDQYWRAMRVRIGEYYGIYPAQVDDMPMSDILDTIEVMAADQHILQIDTKK